jgi:hypothetical protein
MKLVLKFILCLVIAAMLGLGSAIWAINHLPAKTALVANGAWHTSQAFGSSRADWYTRALVARTGLFALNRSETIYFIAQSDNSGRPLHSGCEYSIEGRDLNTRWWSLTAYGEDHFLIPNKEKRYSINGHNVMAEAGGRFKITLSPTPKGSNWLPAGDQDQIYLALRLYNPEPEIYKNIGRIQLPSIIRAECK